MQKETHKESHSVIAEEFVSREPREAMKRDDHSLESLLGFSRTVEFQRLSLDERIELLDKIDVLMRTCLVSSRSH